MPRPLQRRLMLVRHAKAVEEGVGGDHARSLSARGQADAKKLSEWLKEKNLVPDAALCSTAARTRQTMAVLTHNIPTILSDRLYLASVGEMLALLQATDDAVETLMLVAHNPGSHGLLALLAGAYVDENDADRLLLKFPTSGFALLQFEVARWCDIAPRTGTLAQLRFAA